MSALSGLPLLRTEQSGQDIRWAYDRQAAGSSRNFDVTIIPTQEGRFETCTIVTADPILCLPMLCRFPAPRHHQDGSFHARSGRGG